jgi:LPXTG-motif cell wall-anchored protein
MFTVLIAVAATALAFALPAAAAPSSHRTSGTAGTSGDTSQPQPQSKADQNSGGANGQCPNGPYCSTRHGAASGNGNQTQGKHTGEPCAGCVGKADNKNPKGQMPNGSDHNAGYECDRNHGIGRTNPAHTGCTTTPPTDCTTNPTASGCGQNSSGGGDCTTNPTASGCGQNSSGGSSGCAPTAANNFCSDVLGERLVTTPNTPTAPNASSSLPHTGAAITAMLLLSALTIGLGSVAVVASRRRRRV